MLIPSNTLTQYQDKRRDKKAAQAGQQVLQLFGQGLQDKTAATGKFMQLAASQTTALQVGAQQAQPMIQNSLKQALKPYGTSSNPNFGATEAPAITADQKIKIGTDALKSTPQFASAYFQLNRADQQLAKASQLEAKLLPVQAQQALEADRKMTVSGGEKFYDAFESPKQIGTAFAGYSKERLIKPDTDSQVLYDPRFKATLEQRYGGNPFQPSPAAKFMGVTVGKQQQQPPQPIGYQSSKGWIYDQKTMDYLKRKDQPEDLSWMTDAQKRY